MPNKTLHLIAFCAARKLAQQKATGELNVSVRQEVACPNGPNLTKKKKQRFSGRKKGGAPLVRLPIERVDQSGEESSFAFRGGAITALSAPEPGIEQIPHGIAEHV